MAIADELIALLGFRIEGEEQAKRFQNRIEQLENRLGRFAQTAGRLAGVATAAMATGFGLLGRSVINTSAQFEKFEATLATIEGSSEAARKSLDWISDFAKTTPYEVSELTSAFVKLKAYGIDPIANETLTILGDTAAAMGKTLNQSVEAFADAATFQFERLKEFGITSSTVGNQVTFEWTKNGETLTRTVKKNSDEIRTFLLENFGDRFAGAMDLQSKTFQGMMSNLSDTWTDFQRRVGEAGFFNRIKEQLEGLLSSLERLDADGSLDRWAKTLSDGFTFAANVIGRVFQRIAENFLFLAEHADKLKVPLATIASLFGLLMVRAFPLFTIFSLLVLAVDDFFAYLQGGDSIVGSFIDWIQELTGVSETVAQSFTGLAAMVAGTLAAAFIIAPKMAVIAFGKILVAGLLALKPVIGGALASALFLLTNPVGWAILLAGAAAGLIWYFWEELVEAWDALSTRTRELFSNISDWWADVDLSEAAGALLKQFSDWLLSFDWSATGVGVVFNLVTSMVKAWEAIAPQLKVLFATLSDWILNTDWIGVGQEAVSRFWDGLSAAWNQMAEKIQALFAQMVDWILSIDWVGVGVAIMNAIWEGMKAIGGQIRNWFASLIPDWASGFFSDSGGASDSAANDNGTDEALDKALAAQEEQWGRLTANMKKTGTGHATDATLNDNRQDNRSFPMTVNTEINQTVNGTTDAPRQAAQATGAAVNRAVTGQRTQIEQEPSF